MLTIKRVMEIAVQHHRAGQFQEAESLYRQILDHDPNNADALHLLGVIAHQTGNHQNSAALILRAIELNPGVADFHANLGEAYAALGRLEKAIIHNQRAIALEANFPEAYYNLGNVFQEKGLTEPSIAAYRKAIELKPDFVEAHANLGNVLRDSGLFEDAVAAYRKAIALRPDGADAFCNLGIALFDMGRLAEAAAAYEKAIQLRPEFAHAHWNKALLLLIEGRFAQGWVEYEWRWQVRGLTSLRPSFPQPQWKGSDPSGRTILLYTEQGLGDVIQFIRYAPLLASRGARVAVACQKEMTSLVQDMEGVEQAVAGGEPLPPFDMHSPLMSLPLAFGTTIETIPAQTPYLRADPARVEAWRGKLSHDGGRLKVGLVWAGRPAHRKDRCRSTDLSALAPLAHVEGISFYSLQKGEWSAQAKTPPPGMRLVDLTEEIQDFADTAALMAHLDLVISVDTAVAHLAGAVAKPVWTLLPFMPDWRWMLDREDSPWYPTMRLFRQPAAGDWEGAVRRVAQELRKFTAG